MKKFIFAIVMLLATVSYVSAQHVVESKVFDNTYVNVTAGGVVPTTNVDFDNVRPQFGLEVGKSLTTLYTMGVSFNTAVNTTGVKTAFDQMSVMWLHKLDLTNLIGGYEMRKWNVQAVAGLGWGHDMVVRDNYGVFNTGVEVAYNINSAWSVLAKPQIEWRHVANGLNVNNSNLGLSIGVSYKFPNSDGCYGFEICHKDQVYRDNARLNDEVNELRRKLQECENRPPVEVVREVIKEVPVTNTVEEQEVNLPKVQFLINSSKLTETSQVAIQDMAEMINATNDKFVVRGYASEEGSEDFNKELSLQRAETVKNALVNAGVNPDQLEVEGCGATNQFSKDVRNLNRVVVVKK